jgi:YfiH family protein
VIIEHTDYILRSDALSELTWLDHGFGTRLSGTWFEGEPTAIVRQIHSANVFRVNSQTGYLGEGDALITRTPGVWAAVRTADCVPLIVADPVTQSAAVIHAGWRGTVQEIVAATLHNLHAAFGSNPADMIAAIGPSIGECCFEVGPEVAEQFEKWHPERDDLRQRTRIDLREVLQRQLRAAGFAESRIDRDTKCTRCDASRFHSFRRDRELAGRMVSAVRVNG